MGEQFQSTVGRVEQIMISRIYKWDRQNHSYRKMNYNRLLFFEFATFGKSCTEGIKMGKLLPAFILDKPDDGFYNIIREKSGKREI